MDLPIEIFMLGIGVSIALALFGFIRNPQIPAMLVFGGMFFMIFAIATDNLIMDTFSSTEGSEAIYHYNVESRTGAVSLTDINTAIAEFASTGSSQLVGDTINCIDLYISKSGLPTGIAEIGTLDGSASGNIIVSFGTINVSTLTTASDWKTFCLSGDSTYTIQTNDRIGIRFTNGTASNTLNTSVDANNPFDSTITFRQVIVSGVWTSSTSQDLTAIFYLSETPQETTNTPILFEFTEMVKVLFALFGVIMMLCGAIMVGKGI